MTRKRKPVPAFANEAEERLFWENTDSADYVDWSAADRVRLPNLKPTSQQISLRLPVTLLERIKTRPTGGTFYQSLIKAWLAEKTTRPERLVTPADSNPRTRQNLCSSCLQGHCDRT